MTRSASKRWWLLTGLVLGITALVALLMPPILEPEPAEAPITAPSALPRGDGPLGFALQAEPMPMPDLRFTNAQGEALSLADFRGRTVLLNIWATWCVPCREEMGALDRLQAELGGPGFIVVAVSNDRGGLADVQAFYDEIGIENLGIYLDPDLRVPQATGAVGLPTTLLIDPQGREIGRLIGPAEWDSPDSIDFLRRHLPAAPEPSHAAASATSPARAVPYRKEPA